MGFDLGSLVGMGGDLVSGAFNAFEASKNRNFQEKMRNTAYQAAAIDLEKAGLNRILALGSPAATPSGSAATMPSLGASFASGTSAKSQASLQAEQKKLVAAQTENMQADTAKKSAETEAVATQMELALAQAQGVREQIPGWRMVPQVSASTIARNQAGANLDAETARVRKMEAAQAEVLKSLYEMVGNPLVDFLRRNLGTDRNSARDNDFWDELFDRIPGLRHVPSDPNHPLSEAGRLRQLRDHMKRKR